MKYRKKPVVIDAVQLTGAMAAGSEALPEGVYLAPQAGRFCLTTLEGVMGAQVGDYVLTGVQGEKYFCKRDIFELTYELAE